MGAIDLPEYELTEQENIKVEEIISKYEKSRSSIIPALQQIQDTIGFLPLDVQIKVASGIGVPEKDVYGVVTFYSFFTMTPRGKYNIRVCMGTACFVKGAGKIVENISKEFNIKPGETTLDRNYSLQINRCLGACGIAPVIVINDKVYQKVDPQKAIDIIYTYK
ncbi:MAG TPA: NAD(P)H-dependent oxidoreductase subunit E [Actinobacteria bacterium]|nr:NAD(P)H-dependent oxidoreductase subunit E [Actinomycetota bacterium]